MFDGPVEELWQAERAHQHDEDEHEGEESEEPPVCQRRCVGRHGMLEKGSDRALAKFADPVPL